VDETVDAAQLGTGAEPGRSLLVTGHLAAGVTAPEEIRSLCWKISEEITIS
jgi:hypothetical protein